MVSDVTVSVQHSSDFDRTVVADTLDYSAHVDSEVEACLYDTRAC